MNQRGKILLLLALLLGLVRLTMYPPFQPAEAAVRKASLATVQQFPSALGIVTVTPVAQGLENPWSLAFLPDGRMLVTERPGRMRVITADGKLGAALTGLPAVHAEGQGGLLDVVLAPDHASSGEITFCYAEPRGKTNGTAVARARLVLKGNSGTLENVQVIFRQQPGIDSNHHFGCRLVFARDGSLFLTLGDRGSEREQAQRPENHIGKLVRIHRDGSVPADNPYLKNPAAARELWSIGHRNIQGAALHPVSGQLWLTEHGPKGGDEVNAPKPGRNYGWPVISHGVNYSGTAVGEGISAKPGLEPPLLHWTPSIAPSGLAFYHHDRFAPWRGNLFAGSLKFGLLVRMTLDGENIIGEERLLQGLNRRIRDVRQGPDGALYLLIDEADGAILKVTLAPAAS